MLIDDFENADLVSALGTRWRGVTDTVMGGVSNVRLRSALIDGQSCLHLSGQVSLENNGGFVQAALDLATSSATLDASRYKGIRLTARGNSEEYAVHLRTADVMRPWQSYRNQFTVQPQWRRFTLPFSSFQPHRLTTPLDCSRLRRLGLVAIGRAFRADLAVAELEFYE